MKRWFWLLIGTLLIVSLSCSLLPGRDDTNADEPDAVATSEVVGADEGDPVAPPADALDDEDSDEAGAFAVDADALDQLDSYRARLTWRTETGDGTVEAFTMEQSATRNPAAERFVMESDDGDVEFIQIGSDTWMRFGEDWMQTSSDEESDFGDMLSSGDDWISDVGDGDYEFVGRETVNGINTRRYRVEYKQGLLGLFDSGDDLSDVEEGTAEVWIADESNLPQFAVKYEIVMMGTSDGESVTVTLVQEVFSINEPIVIEAPEGVGGLPEGIPMYPDATDVTSMGTLTMFTVDDDVETVNDFYVDALDSAGWSEAEGGMVTEEMVSTTWEKDGQTLTLMITSGDDGTSVMLSVE